MSEPQQAASGQLSQDGQLVWDGQQWRPITSHAWQPTSWTRPMQLATGGYFIITSLLGLLSSFLLQAQIREASLKALQKSNPGMSPENAQQAVNFSLTFVLVFGVLFGVLFVILGILSIIRRWSWVFYVDLVLLALSSLGLIGTLLNLGNPNSPNPAALTAINLVTGVVALGLFVWMLVARIQRGVWACTKVPQIA
ncbi:MAG: hypothetical protein M3Z13_02415 [Candidatus Dormibacteraeota bacterium]|nr:hypothetical protein [Candidatus Dormibacteraeota bacterium]